MPLLRRERAGPRASAKGIDVLGPWTFTRIILFVKVALVHELLTMRGGAERVLRVLADMFPDAPIYTLLYDERALGQWFPPERVRTSRLQKHAWLSTNHHLYLKRFPAAVEAWDFSAFDLVISASSAFTHGIITNGKPKHLCYVHSPARYLWDRSHDVQSRAAHGPLGPLKKWYLSHTFHPLRVWDAEAADRPDMLLAASREVQRRIELYWRQESDVVYPPIDERWLEKSEVRSQKSEEYFLIVSTLAEYKRIDLAVEACNQLKAPLKIVGEGPAFASLKRIAGPTIEFLGYRPHEELRALYANAMATLFPGEEDFGLVPLESMACGTPVIAYARGGALETVVEGTTGTFFREHTPVSLAEVIRRFDRARFDPETLRTHAAQFSRRTFEIHIEKHVRDVMSEHR